MASQMPPVITQGLALRGHGHHRALGSQEQWVHCFLCGQIRHPDVLSSKWGILPVMSPVPVFLNTRFVVLLVLNSQPSWSCHFYLCPWQLGVRNDWSTQFVADFNLLTMRAYSTIKAVLNFPFTWKKKSSCCILWRGLQNGHLSYQRCHCPHGSGSPHWPLSGPDRLRQKYLISLHLKTL
jgi:hypothetical protein